jgi:hypothetical protein
MINYEELTLDSEVFEKVREDFDILFQRLLKKMEQNNSDEGSITLKVDVEIQKDFIQDSEGGSREIQKPILKSKITSTVPVKDSFDNKKDTGMDLVWDDELGRYVLKYFSANGQRSIFDPDFQENVQGEATDEENLLPGPSNLLPDSGGIEDADYREVMDVPEDGGNDVMNVPDEEITDDEAENAPAGDTEAQEADYEDDDTEDYEYDDPEEE